MQDTNTYPTIHELTVARVCHQANKALCDAYGDMSQPDWDDAPEWQRGSRSIERIHRPQ